MYRPDGCSLILPHELAGPCAPPVRLVGCPHPLRMERVDRFVAAGPTLLEMVAGACDDLAVPSALRGFGYAWVDGQAVPFSRWGEVRPGAGQTVTVRVAPGNPSGGGGGNKDVTRSLMTIAVVAAAIVSQQYYLATYGSSAIAGVSASVAGYSTASMVGAGLVAAGVAAVGMAAVNAMVPVRAAQLGSLSSASGGTNTSEESYSITGMQNSADPYGTVPLALGTVRWAPNHAALPFTENVDNERYVRANLDWGYGPLTIEGQRIGDTDLAEFEGVEDETTNGADGIVPSLYPGTVVEEALAVELVADEPVVRTTNAGVDEFSVDIAFPRLVQFTSGGGLANQTCNVDLEWRKVGASTWNQTTFIPGRGLWDMGDASPRWGTNLYLVVVDATNLRTGVVQRFSATGTPETPVAPSGWSPVALVQRYCEVGGSPVYSIEEEYEPDGWTGLAVTIENESEIWVGDGESTTHPFYVTAHSTEPVYRTRVIRPGERGQYEVRLTRTTPTSTSTSVYDDVTWSALRSIVNDPAVVVDYPNARTELRIKASGELNGTLERFNGLTTTVCLDWDYEAEEWVERPTNNCASLVRHVLQCEANPRPRTDAQIDLAALEDFHDWCRINDFTFNQKRDGDCTVWETLQDICGAGRAAPIVRDGKWSVIIDRPRDTVVQDITRAMCWGFKGSRDLRQMPHALRVTFVSEETWETDEILVYADGYDADTATLIEKLDLPGVTTSDQAWRLGRYHLACMDLRREPYTWSMDWAHMICQRGDLVTVAHPVPMWGLSDGRVKAVTDLGDGAWSIAVDEPCVMEEGKDYCVRLITNELERSVRPVTTVAGETYTLELPAEAGALDPEAGWRFAFGEEGREVNEVLISGIRPGADFSAELTGVDYAPGVYEADQGEIPAWDPNISRSPFVQSGAPGAPRILSLTSDESVMVRDAAGVLQPRISVAYTLAGGRVPAETVECQVREEGEAWRSVPSVAAGKAIKVADVETGAVYDVRIRAAFAGMASSWVTSAGHEVSGATNPPPDVSGIYRQGDSLYWVYDSPPPDLEGFRVRVLAGATRNWSKGTDWPSTGSVIVDRQVDVSDLGSGVQTVMVRAQDASKNLSEGMACLTMGLGEYAPANVVATVDEHADGFVRGVVVGGGVDAEGDLVADDTGEAYLPDYESLYLPLVAENYLPVAYGELTYDWTYIPELGDVPGVAYLDLSVDGDGWAVLYRRRGTQDDYLAHDDEAYLPEDSFLYLDGATPWARFPGSVSVGREAVDFRVQVDAGSRQGVVSALAVCIDVEDITESFEDVVISSAGTRLPITLEYRLIDYVGEITLQDDGYGATGVVVLDKDPALGPMLAAVGASQATIDVRNMKGH